MQMQFLKKIFSQLLIYEYDAIHRQKLSLSLVFIKKIKFCDLCKKTIIKKKKNYGWIWGLTKSLNNYCSDVCRKNDIDDLDVY